MEIFKKLQDQYKGVFENLRLYWKLYGGSKSLIASPYLHLALLISFACKPVWNVDHEAWAWFDICNSVLPNILGFTLGGYAILLAFGSSKFMEVIAGDDPDEDGDSPFMTINATFLHFIIIQAIALIFSIIALAWNYSTGPVAFIGFFLFSYALTISIAAAFAILRLAKWYDNFITNERKKNDAL